MSLPLSLYQHPTQVVLVDDSASFVAGLAYQMPAGRPVRGFTQSSEALAWIHAAARVDRERLARLPGALADLPLDARRFQVPAVVVVDFVMPDMDGLAFCRALAGLPCKKILFTGEADERVAVDAFNRGLIDRYHKKFDPDAFELLLRDIEVLERAFFLECAARAPHPEGWPRLACLSDPAVADLLERLRREEGVIEHYAFTDPDRLLLLDRDGRASVLVLENEAGMAAHLEAADAYGAPEALRQALRSRTMLPFFWQTGGMYNDALQDWAAQLRPAEMMDGLQTWYWAMFPVPEGWLASAPASLGGFMARPPLSFA